MPLSIHTTPDRCYCIKSGHLDQPGCYRFPAASWLSATLHMRVESFFDGRTCRIFEITVPAIFRNGRDSRESGSSLADIKLVAFNQRIECRACNTEQLRCLRYVSSGMTQGPQQGVTFSLFSNLAQVQWQ